MKKRIFYPRLLPDKAWLVADILVLSLLFLSSYIAIAASLPGDDQAINKLNAAGTLLKLIDSFIFVFGARILAGLCVLAAGWNLKEQRFSMAIVCIFAAILIATVPLWIKNLFDMGGGSIFTQ